MGNTQATTSTTMPSSWEEETTREKYDNGEQQATISNNDLPPQHYYEDYDWLARLEMVQFQSPCKTLIGQHGLMDQTNDHYLWCTMAYMDRDFYDCLYGYGVKVPDHIVADGKTSNNNISHQHIIHQVDSHLQQPDEEGNEEHREEELVDHGIDQSQMKTERKDENYTTDVEQYDRYNGDLPSVGDTCLLRANTYQRVRQRADELKSPYRIDRALEPFANMAVNSSSDEFTIDTELDSEPQIAKKYHNAATGPCYTYNTNNLEPSVHNRINLGVMNRKFEHCMLSNLCAREIRDCMSSNHSFSQCIANESKLSGCIEKLHTTYRDHIQKEEQYDKKI